jgi:hypothetical protein
MARPKGYSSHNAWVGFFLKLKLLLYVYPLQVELAGSMESGPNLFKILPRVCSLEVELAGSEEKRSNSDTACSGFCILLPPFSNLSPLFHLQSLSATILSHQPFPANPPPHCCNIRPRHFSPPLPGHANLAAWIVSLPGSLLIFPGTVAWPL